MIAMEDLQALTKESREKIVANATSYLINKLNEKMIETAEQGLYEGTYDGFSHDANFDKVKKLEFRQGVGNGFPVHFIEYVINSTDTNIKLEYAPYGAGIQSINFSWKKSEYMIS